jgi:hypothetical protein
MIRYDFSLQDSLPNLYAELDKIYDAKILCSLYDASYIIRGGCRWLLNNKQSKFAIFFDANILKIKWITTYVKKEKDWGYWKKRKNEYFTSDESINMYSNLERYLDSLNIKFTTYTLFHTDKVHNSHYPQFNLNTIRTNELVLEDEGHINNKGHELIAHNLFYMLTHSSLPLNDYKIDH